jgi:hypothetical protein
LFLVGQPVTDLPDPVVKRGAVARRVLAACARKDLRMTSDGRPAL